MLKLGVKGQCMYNVEVKVNANVEVKRLMHTMLNVEVRGLMHTMMKLRD